MSFAATLRTRVQPQARQPSRGSARQGKRLTRTVFYLVLTALAVYAMAPLVIVLFASLKSEQALAANPLGPPTQFVWSNFTTAWTQIGRAHV